MESPTFSLLLLLLSIVFILLIRLLIKMVLNIPENSNSHNLPPGPLKLPIIGNMHNLIGEHPHRRLRTLANTHGPLLHLKLGEINLIVITSTDLVREVFRTHDLKFASRPELLVSKIIFYDTADFGLAPYGKTWSQLRKICTVELMSPKRVKSFSFIREEEGDILVKKIRAAGAARSPVNLSEMLLSAANRTIARAAFGKECAHQESFLVAMKEIFTFLSGFSLVDLFPSWTFILGEVIGLRGRMERVHQKIDAILNVIIGEHEAKKVEGDGVDEDLVDVLLRFKKPGELTTDNVKAVILDLFLAGTETSAATLEWAMTELIRHPKVMRKAQLEVRNALKGHTGIEERSIINLNYLNQIIKETLRLHPTGPLLVPRLCRETVELLGYTVPAGSRVVVNAWAIMRDPSRWEDPEKFVPERFERSALDFGSTDFEYIPFGGGRRICPGMSFAIASMQYWLAQLLFYFDWEMSGGKISEELDVEESFGLTLTRKNDLCLLATFHEIAF